MIIDILYLIFEKLILFLMLFLWLLLATSEGWSFFFDCLNYKGPKKTKWLLSTIAVCFIIFSILTLTSLCWFLILDSDQNWGTGLEQAIGILIMPFFSLIITLPVLALLKWQIKKNNIQLEPLNTRNIIANYLKKHWILVLIIIAIPLSTFFILIHFNL